MRHSNSLFIITIVLGLLTGCSHYSPRKGDFRTIPWPVRQKQLHQLQCWQMKGAVAIHRANDASSASLIWRQSVGNYQIDLIGPLGFSHIVIHGTPKQVMLTERSGQRTSASNPEKLMDKTLGWHLPITNLYYWIRSMPAPGKSRKQFDQYGHLVQLSQQGWQIQFDNYINRSGVDLATQLTLSHTDIISKIKIKSIDYIDSCK